MSTDRWMDKDAVYKYNGIPLRHKEEQNNAIWAKWMDLEVMLLSDVNQKEKDKYHRTSFIGES